MAAYFCKESCGLERPSLRMWRHLTSVHVTVSIELQSIHYCILVGINSCHGTLLNDKRTAGLDSRWHLSASQRPRGTVLGQSMLMFTLVWPAAAFMHSRPHKLTGEFSTEIYSKGNSKQRFIAMHRKSHTSELH